MQRCPAGYQWCVSVLYIGAAARGRSVSSVGVLTRCYKVFMSCGRRMVAGQVDTMA